MILAFQGEVGLDRLVVVEEDRVHLMVLDCNDQAVMVLDVNWVVDQGDSSIDDLVLD